MTLIANGDCIMFLIYTELALVPTHKIFTIQYPRLLREERDYYYWAAM